MLDFLNEVGGQMVIKYYTITLRPTKDKLLNIRKAGYPTDVMTCIMFGLAASFKDQDKVVAYLKEADAAGAADGRAVSLNRQISQTPKEGNLFPNK